jgi:hypothetical protein
MIERAPGNQPTSLPMHCDLETSHHSGRGQRPRCSPSTLRPPFSSWRPRNLSPESTEGPWSRSSPPEAPAGWRRSFLIDQLADPDPGSRHDALDDGVGLGVYGGRIERVVAVHDAQEPGGLFDDAPAPSRPEGLGRLVPRGGCRRGAAHARDVRSSDAWEGPADRSARRLVAATPGGDRI